jgi:hypothetical protein
MQGNELYLPASTALELINKAEAGNLAVIGLEGFTKVGERLRPRLDLIADYSRATGGQWEEFRKVCNQAAARFIENAPPESDLVFSPVLTSEREHEEFQSAKANR